MIRTPGGLLVLVVLLTAINKTGAQAPLLPDPGDTSAFVDRNGPLLKGDPWLDGACGPSSGWFAAAEAGFVRPEICGTLLGFVSVPGGYLHTVSLPIASFDWTVAPRIDAGYRFDQAAGEFLVSYRSLAAEGQNTLGIFDMLGGGQLTSRLDLHTLDLDYAQHECGVPSGDMKWRIGARLASVFYDSRGIGSLLDATSSTHFLGGGPHAALELSHTFRGTGLALYSRFEGLAMLGQVRQNFAEVFTLPGTPPFGGFQTITPTQSILGLEVQAGVAWTPWPEQAMRVLFGYQFSGWWYVGQTEEGSTGNLTVQGLFLRGEWGY